MKQPVFITGNQHKADYLSRMLGVTLEHQKVELNEIQSLNLETIVRHKVRQAYTQLKQPVLVEDVALGFKALGGLPGPFVKFFVDAPDGLNGMCRILDGFRDRRAVAACVFGYYDGEHMRLFRGELEGTIASQPRGSSGYGWDKIFEPIGYGGRTRAELTETEDIETYRIIKSLVALREFLES